MPEQPGTADQLLPGPSEDIKAEHDDGAIQRNEPETRAPDLTVETIASSIFTAPQKSFIILLASIAGAFSTLCSYIYYPALIPIASELHVSITLVNLTITSYLLVAAVAPAFMGSMADQSGRRPIYILMFALFIGANVGIALQTSFPALLVLRMVQSAGSSGEFCVGCKKISESHIWLTCDVWDHRANCGCVRSHSGRHYAQ